jgi:hypothetical protein
MRSLISSYELGRSVASMVAIDPHQRPTAGDLLGLQTTLGTPSLVHTSSPSPVANQQNQGTTTGPVLLTPIDWTKSVAIALPQGSLIPRKARVARSHQNQVQQLVRHPTYLAVNQINQVPGVGDLLGQHGL